MYASDDEEPFRRPRVHSNVILDHSVVFGKSHYDSGCVAAVLNKLAYYAESQVLLANWRRKSFEAVRRKASAPKA